MSIQLDEMLVAPLEPALELLSEIRCYSSDCLSPWWGSHYGLNSSGPPHSPARSVAGRPPR